MGGKEGVREGPTRARTAKSTRKQRERLKTHVSAVALLSVL